MIEVPAIKPEASYAVEEVAAMLPGRTNPTMDPVSLVRAIRQGRVAGTKIMGRWHIKGDEVLRLLTGDR